MVGAYQIRGLARIRLNKFDDAISDYRAALKYDPENVVLWHNLSLCHIQKKDYETAKDDLGKLLTIAPRYTRAYLIRGEVSLLQKDTVQALQDFDKAIELDRYDADGWGARAVVRIQQGKLQGGGERFGPGYPPKREERGELYQPGFGSFPPEQPEGRHERLRPGIVH